MNDVFIMKCKDYTFFSSIRYSVHCIEDSNTMYEKILEICDINPYLGTLIYITSEENVIFEKRLTEILDRINTKSNLDLIQIALSWDLLRKSEKCVEYLKKISKYRWNKKQLWNKNIDEFWMDLLFQVLVKKEYYSYLYLFMDDYYNINGNLDILSKEDMIDILQDLWKSNQIGIFVATLDKTGMYGELSNIVGDMNYFYDKLFKLYINQKLHYCISYKQRMNPMERITAFYLLNGGESKKYLQLLKNVKYKHRVLVGKQPLYFYINTFSNNVYGKKGEIKLSPLLTNMWSKELNGFKKPLECFVRESDSVWWKGTCGHVWKRTISEMKKNTKCPICKEG